MRALSVFGVYQFTGAYVKCCLLIRPISSHARNHSAAISASSSITMFSFRFLTATLSAAALCGAVTSSWRSYELGPLRPRTPDVVTDNVLVLRQTEVSPDAKASRMRRRMINEARGIRRRATAQAPLTELPAFGYAADVSIDGKTYPVVVAIVSSDLWVAVDGFQCLNGDWNKTKVSSCVHDCTKSSAKQPTASRLRIRSKPFQGPSVRWHALEPELFHRIRRQ